MHLRTAHLLPFSIFMASILYFPFSISIRYRFTIFLLSIVHYFVPNFLMRFVNGFFRTMTAVCFVCNLPILSHQVGLVWQGGNGWDDLMREQLEESTLKARLGGRRDSSAQITTISPPTETQETSPPPRRRRRSSLAQLTDIFKDWGGSAARKRKEQFTRRETLADLTKSLPWNKSENTRKRRESSVDSGVKSSSSKSRPDSQYSNARPEIYRLLSASRRQSTTAYSSDPIRNAGENLGRRDSTARRGSVESGKSSRRDSLTMSSPKHRRRHHHGIHQARGRRDSKTDFQLFREERRTSLTTESLFTPQLPSTSSKQRCDMGSQALPPPTIITSSVTPPSTSPSVSPPCHTPSIPEPSSDSPPSRPTSPQIPLNATAFTGVTSPVTPPNATESTVTPILSPTHPFASGSSRRDSHTQVGNRKFQLKKNIFCNSVRLKYKQSMEKDE